MTCKRSGAQIPSAPPFPERRSCSSAGVSPEQRSLCWSDPREPRVSKSLHDPDAGRLAGGMQVGEWQHAGVPLRPAEQALGDCEEYLYDPKAGLRAADGGGRLSRQRHEVTVEPASPCTTAHRTSGERAPSFLPMPILITQPIPLRTLRRFGTARKVQLIKSAQVVVSLSKNGAMSSGGQSVARFVFLSTWATVMRQRARFFPSESTMVHSMSASGPRNSRTNVWGAETRVRAVSRRSVLSVDALHALVDRPPTHPPAGPPARR